MSMEIRQFSPNLVFTSKWNFQRKYEFRRVAIGSSKMCSHRSTLVFSRMCMRSWFHRSKNIRTTIDDSKSAGNKSTHGLLEHMHTPISPPIKRDLYDAWQEHVHPFKSACAFVTIILFLSPSLPIMHLSLPIPPPTLSLPPSPSLSPSILSPLIHPYQHIYLSLFLC